MTEKTISTYRGFGHRVQLIRRQAVARQYAIIDNRRILSSSTHEVVAKEAFLNIVAGIVRQTALEL